MPICRECGRMAATAEMRRLPKGGYKCKDSWRCEQHLRKPEWTREEAEQFIHRKDLSDPD